MILFLSVLLLEMGENIFFFFTSLQKSISKRQLSQYVFFMLNASITIMMIAVTLLPCYNDNIFQSDNSKKKSKTKMRRCCCMQRRHSKKRQTFVNNEIVDIARNHAKWNGNILQAILLSYFIFFYFSRCFAYRHPPAF